MQKRAPQKITLASYKTEDCDKIRMKLKSNQNDQTLQQAYLVTILNALLAVPAGLTQKQNMNGDKLIFPDIAVCATIL